jgi:hypothetical protein
MGDKVFAPSMGVLENKLPHPWEGKPLSSIDTPDLDIDNISGSSLCGVKFLSPFLPLQLTGD